jgi:PIN domain nuclease of toxin-antitoxin system
MRLLLDTHVLLWASEISEELSRKAKALIAGPQDHLVFSVVSLWEVEIKRTGNDVTF